MDILTDFQKKCGLTAKQRAWGDNREFLELCHGSRFIGEYPNTGILSPDEIRRDADTYLIERVNEGGYRG